MPALFTMRNCGAIQHCGPGRRRPRRGPRPAGPALVAALAAAALAGCTASERSVAPAVASTRPSAAASAAAPNLLIVEVMADPAKVADAAGEYVKLYNPGPADVDLTGYQLLSASGTNVYTGAASGAGSTVERHTIAPAGGQPLLVPAGTCIVLGNNASSAQNGGITTEAYAYGTSITLGNNQTDWVELKTPAGLLLDSVAYSASTVSGTSRTLTPPVIQPPTGVALLVKDPSQPHPVAADTAIWQRATTPFGAGDLGTPNDCQYSYRAPGGSGPGPVTRVTIAPATASVNAGATVTLTATSTDSTGAASPTTFTWASADTTVATVNGSGVVTGVKAAAAPVTITATSANGVRGSAAITVTTPGTVTVTRVTFTSSATSFPVGFQTQLFATPYRGPGSADTLASGSFTRTWEALTPSIATIDNGTGVVTATGAGTPQFRVTITPTNGAPYQATSTTLTVETSSVADSASTYGDNLDFGAPAATGGPNALLIRRRQYAASYNGSLGQPNWVSYEYDARQSGGEDRCNCFTTDPLAVAAGLPAVTTADYTGSGYSRGHMTRSADRTTTNVENASTFYLSNIVPQNQDNNAGPWAAVENMLGDSTRAGRAVYIAAGPYFTRGQTPRTLNNAGKVAIPDSVWKVAIVVGRDPATGLPRKVTDVTSWRELSGVSVIAVMMPNVGYAQGLNSDWHAYQRTVDQVEAVTGFDVLNLLQLPYQSALEAGDHAPVPALAGPSTGAAGQALTFDASGSSDPDANETLSYTWSFGDGTTASGATVTRTYAATGSYPVTLTVTDRSGWTATRTQTITVGAVAVTASLDAAAPGYATTVRAGATFAAVARFSDPSNRAPWHLVIDWGDSTQFAVTSASQSPLTRGKVWSTPGTYAVRFTATNAAGVTGTVAALTVTVTP